MEKYILQLMNYEKFQQILLIQLHLILIKKLLMKMLKMKFIILIINNYFEDLNSFKYIIKK